MRARVYLVVLPWVLFVVVDRYSGPGARWAALTALATAATILTAAVARGTVTRLEVGSTGLLAMVFAAACVVRVNPGTMPDRYSRAAVVALIAAVVAISLIGTPLTERFVSDEVPVPLAQTMAFHTVNRSLTRGLLAMTSTISASFVAGAVFHTDAGRTIFNWVAPLVILALGALWLSARWNQYLYVDARRQEFFGLRPPGGTLLEL